MKIDRADVILEIENIVGKTADQIEWKDICNKTKFDSFVTVLAVGLGWGEAGTDSKLIDQKDSSVNIILFNLRCFPKEM